MTANQLHDALCKLQDSEVKTLIFKFGVPTAMLPGENAPRAERLIALLEWAETRGRIAEVERLYRELVGANALPR